MRLSIFVYDKRNYSPTTLAIALTLAKNFSDNQPLVINGSKKFKKAIFKTAVDSNLDFSFADENFQRTFFVTKARKKFEEQKANFNSFYVTRGSKNIFPFQLFLSDQQRQLAEQTAEKILHNLDELKTKIFATAHFEYINREKKYANRGDCIFTSHHLPTWAKDNPKNFFKAADKYEGKNNRRYVEIEFSLPNELTKVEDYKKIIDKFINLHLKDHYYAYAIHDKLGAFSEIRHPHCHIMFSERLIDDVEKIQQRSPQNFFKYPARNKHDGSEPTFEEKLLRGSLRDRKWCNRNFILQMREDFAKIQNDILAEKGFSVRVDHRSLKAQPDDAIRNGDLFLAKLFDRVPEKNLPPIPLDDDNPSVLQLKKQREDRRNQADLLFNVFLSSQKNEREKIKKSTANFTLASINFLYSTEVNNSDADNLQSLKTEVWKFTRELSALRHSFISVRKAEQQAKFEYMSHSERNLYTNFQDIKSRRDNLQKFLSNLQKPVYDPEKSFEKICDEVNQQIKTYNASLKFLQSAFDQLEHKLQSPQLRKNIQLATHNILKQNFFVREKLKVATDNLFLVTEKLRDDIFKTATPNQKFQLRELAFCLFQHYLALKKDREKLLAVKNSCSKKILSPARAQKIAENIFVGGAWKKYREDVRYFDKHKFSMHHIQKNYLEKKLEVEKNRLLNLCALPDSQKKIAEISVAILRKNSNLSKKVAAIDLQIQKLSSQINHLYKQLATLKKILPKEKPNTFYKLRSSPDHKPTKNILDIASIVADAFLGDSNAVSLTARITDKGFEMPFDWNLISDIKKGEIAHKRMLAKI